MESEIEAGFVWNVSPERWNKITAQNDQYQPEELQCSLLDHIINGGVVQAINALRNTVLHRLLRLLKKRWKQSWPGQNKSFLKVQDKFGWPQQKSSSARLGSLKPREYFITGVGLHHQHLPLLCVYLCATGARVQHCRMEGEDFRRSSQFQVLLPAAVLPCMAGPASYHHGLSSETGNCLQTAASSWKWSGTELQPWLWGTGPSLPYGPRVSAQTTPGNLLP